MKKENAPNGYRPMVSKKGKAPFKDDSGNTFKPVNVKKGKTFAKVKR